uniref:RRM domain-containing protein n=1 Tax=Timema cristinae TaxID=61476 RepID=A0A7R9CNM4_TIMCR|nr:unnamed protein product [Timema cristinae]
MMEERIEDIRTSSTPPKTKIFVGRLPEDAQAADLRRLFEQYGVVTECDILNRYGFVHMKTEEMATRAIQELNNADFMGVQISVEQSTGKRSGRGGGRGGFGPMRGRGGMRGMGRAPPYMRDGRDYDRRPGLPPPPSMRNGYYDSYDRGYDSYYSARGPPPLSRDRGALPSLREPERRSAYPDMIRSPYERRSFSDLGRSPYDRPALPPVGAFERRSDYAGRLGSEMYRRRSPPPPASSYGGGSKKLILTLFLGMTETLTHMAPQPDGLYYVPIVTYAVETDIECEGDKESWCHWNEVCEDHVSCHGGKQPKGRSRKKWEEQITETTLHHHLLIVTCRHLADSKMPSESREVLRREVADRRLCEGDNVQNVRR